MTTTINRAPGTPDALSSRGASYTSADQEYFDKRSLKRSAGVWGLWGIAVAAVVSGDFSGWNAGISTAGWGGLLVATAVVVVMYHLMISSISEMSSAMPQTGGAYTFARASMGPWGGFVTGLAETIEYVMTAAVIVYFSGQYADAILADVTGVSLVAHGLTWVWWALLYAVFVGLNALGAETSFRFSIVVSVVSLAILALFAVLAVARGKADLGGLFDVGDGSFLPMGAGAVFFALPFAMWLFLGIEELPLAAEESHDPEHDIPRAGRWGLGTLVVSGLVVLVLNPAVLGATATGESGEPLLDGFRALMPASMAAVISLFALVGLLASVQGIMFAYARNMYSLSRAGYYPTVLSLTSRRQTPAIALWVGAGIGFAVLFLVQYGGSAAGSIVLNIAVWGAVIAYLTQMLSYVLLKRRGRLTGPFHSSYGVVGAAVAGAIALAVFVGILLNPDYRLAVIALTVVYAAALVWFGVRGRNGLVLAPEEELALLEEELRSASVPEPVPLADRDPVDEG